MFNGAYQGRRVLVTGHTGFKGSWLTSWLLKLGAQVVGFSKDVPTKPAMFEELHLAERITHVEGDVRDLGSLRRLIAVERPDFVFHLAAQAIVSTSYEDPVETISTNVVGTMNVLDALRDVEHPCVAVLITSDKCYENVEWIWGYRETDRLGGKDVYSGSKAAAELVIKSYVHSFFRNGHAVRLAVGRAGNVIGGGDWARNRIVVDCIVAWSEGRPVEIRNPNSTRPWQHVLEPLSGYLALGQAVSQQPRLHGEAFNFGPRAEQDHTVMQLLTDLGQQWGLESSDQAYKTRGDTSFHEPALLKLNCDKARAYLKWEPNLEFDETVRMIGDWYGAYYRKSSDMYAMTQSQIEQYERVGRERDRVWSAS
jgi:CDP-glucose 4,6-dehydratase